MSAPQSIFRFAALGTGSLGGILLQVFGESLGEPGSGCTTSGSRILVVELGIADDLLHVGVDLLDDAGGVSASANRPNATLAS